MSDTDDSMIAALLRERAGYEQAGKKDRVALVDEQLRLHGYKPAAAAAQADGAAPAARGRRTAKG